MLTPLTGVSTVPYGYRSMDLGIPRWDKARGCYVLMFGDSFVNEVNPDDPRWISPTIICYSEDLEPIGVPWMIDTHPVINPNENARQLWPYPHNNPQFSTVLPTDFIKIGEWWYVHVMVTQGLGNEKWTEFQRSRDLVNWEHTGKYFSPADLRCTMQTFEQLGDWVYVFGTGGLKRNVPMFLWRVKAEEFPHGRWDTWGWTYESGWEWDHHPTPVLSGEFGELCFRKLGEEHLVLSFFDAEHYEIAALVITSPTQDLTTAPRTVIARGRDDPQLYGGYLVEGDEATSARFVFSRWNTTTDDPYASYVRGPFDLTEVKEEKRWPT